MGRVESGRTAAINIHMSRRDALDLADLARRNPDLASVRVHRRNPFDGAWRNMVSAIVLAGEGRCYWASPADYRQQLATAFSASMRQPQGHS